MGRKRPPQPGKKRPPQSKEKWRRRFRVNLRSRPGTCGCAVPSHPSELTLRVGAPGSHHARYVRSWRFAPPHARARSMLGLRKLHECSSAVGASKSGLRVGGRRGARGPYRGLQAAWRPDCAPLPPMKSKRPSGKSQKWPPLLVCRAPLAANNTISEKRDFPGVRKGLKHATILFLFRICDSST